MTRIDFEALWSAAPYASIVVGPDDAISMANPAAEHLLLTSTRQMIGQSILRFVGDDSPLREVLAQVREGTVSVTQYLPQLWWQDRAVSITLVQACPVHSVHGEVLITFHAPGHAAKIDRSLSNRSAARSVTGMASMLAHEIRNPLAGITGAAQLLAMELDTADRELTELIEAEVKRIGRLVDRFEQFGDNRPTERQEVNAHDILDKAKRAAVAGFAGHHRIIEEYDPSLPPVAGDPEQLQQVFLNLIKNAAEAMGRQPGTIRLKTAYRPGFKLARPGGDSESLPLRITVSDTGPGVPSDLVDIIFDPFVSTRANGSGLGLALVSKVLADHGGIIECQRVNEQTEFQILLPVWRSRNHKSAGVS